jgi:hypothetical protein
VYVCEYIVRDLLSQTVYTHLHSRTQNSHIHVVYLIKGHLSFVDVHIGVQCEHEPPVWIGEHEHNYYYSNCCVYKHHSLYTHSHTHNAHTRSRLPSSHRLEVVQLLLALLMLGASYCEGKQCVGVVPVCESVNEAHECTGAWTHVVSHF